MISDPQTGQTPLERLAQLGHELPPAPAPNASYVPTTRAGDLIYVSGQLAFDAQGEVSTTGRVGVELDLEGGQASARLCALNLLAQLHKATGDLGRITRILKIHVYVASSPDYKEHHKVADGSSDLIVAVLGEPGRHARSAFGVSNLPLDSSVEIDAIVQVRQASS